jgi:chorismate mutase
MDESEANILLNESRAKLDDIDRQLIELIVERTSIAKDIALSKKALNKDLFDSKRENIIKDRICKQIEDEDINQECVLDIFEILFTMSKKEQEKYL